MPAGDEAVVNALVKYLDEADGHDRPWAFDGTPLRLEVCVRSEAWRGWAADQQLSDEVRRGVDSALERVVEAHDVVNRPMLMAASAASDAGAADLVCAWFMVMCWGAGAENRSRLRQWTRAPRTGGFVDALTSTRDAFTSGDLVAAYRTSKLPGVGEAYLTKWLWLLGLARRDREVTPYVLDNRVWMTMRALTWSPTGPNAPARWVDYCRSLDRWAGALNERREDWHADGERIEQLLFDREPGHLNSWLLAQHRPA